MLSFYLFFFIREFVVSYFRGVVMNEAIKHPQAPQGMELKCSDSGIVAECMRSEVAGLRQSNSHARPRMKRNDSEVECRDSSVKRRGKNISQP